MFFKPISPYEVLLYQKETDLIRTIRIQLIKLPDQEYPILAWDEVSLVRKPVHFWDLLPLHKNSN